MTTDNEKRRLLRELEAVEKGWDILVEAYKSADIVPVSALVKIGSARRYLEKRQLVILLQLAESELATANVLRTGRQLGYSEQAIRKAS